jgi:alpha-galactosidase
LISPRDGSEFSVTETVSGDKNQEVVFAFTVATQQGRGLPMLELQGLDPEELYKIGWIEGKGQPGTPDVASGDWWMRYGVQLDLKGDYSAAAFRLDRQR